MLLQLLRRDWEDEVNHGALLFLLPYLAGVRFLVRVFAVEGEDRVELGVDLQPIGIAAISCSTGRFPCASTNPPRHLLLQLPLPLPCALLALLRLRTCQVRVE